MRAAWGFLRKHFNFAESWREFARAHASNGGWRDEMRVAWPTLALCFGLPILGLLEVNDLVPRWLVVAIIGIGISSICCWAGLGYGEAGGRRAVLDAAQSDDAGPPFAANRNRTGAQPVGDVPAIGAVRHEASEAWKRAGGWHASGALTTRVLVAPPLVGGAVLLWAGWTGAGIALAFMLWAAGHCAWLLGYRRGWIEGYRAWRVAASPSM
jgi:hypothetical protein